MFLDKLIEVIKKIKVIISFLPKVKKRNIISVDNKVIGESNIVQNKLTGEKREDSTSVKVKNREKGTNNSIENEVENEK